MQAHSGTHRHTVGDTDPPSHTYSLMDTCTLTYIYGNPDPKVPGSRHQTYLPTKHQGTHTGTLKQTQANKDNSHMHVGTQGYTHAHKPHPRHSRELMFAHISSDQNFLKETHVPADTTMPPSHKHNPGEAQLPSWSSPSSSSRSGVSPQSQSSVACTLGLVLLPGSSSYPTLPLPPGIPHPIPTPS